MQTEMNGRKMDTTVNEQKGSTSVKNKYEANTPANFLPVIAEPSWTCMNFFSTIGQHGFCAVLTNKSKSLSCKEHLSAYDCLIDRYCWHYATKSKPRWMTDRTNWTVLRILRFFKFFLKIDARLVQTSK